MAGYVRCETPQRPAGCHAAYSKLPSYQVTIIFWIHISARIWQVAGAWPGGSSVLCHLSKDLSKLGWLRTASSSECCAATRLRL